MHHAKDQALFANLKRGICIQKFKQSSHAGLSYIMPISIYACDTHDIELRVHQLAVCTYTCNDFPAYNSSCVTVPPSFAFSTKSFSICCSSGQSSSRRNRNLSSMEVSPQDVWKPRECCQRQLPRLLLKLPFKNTETPRGHVRKRSNLHHVQSRVFVWHLRDLPSCCHTFNDGRNACTVTASHWNEKETSIPAASDTNALSAKLRKILPQ